MGQTSRERDTLTADTQRKGYHLLNNTIIGQYTAGQAIAVGDTCAVHMLCKTGDAMEVPAARGSGQNVVWGVELWCVIAGAANSNLEN